MNHINVVKLYNQYNNNNDCIHKEYNINTFSENRSFKILYL